MNMKMKERDAEYNQKLEWLRKAVQDGVDSGPSVPMKDIATLKVQARIYSDAKRQRDSRGHK